MWIFLSVTVLERSNSRKYLVSSSSNTSSLRLELAACP
jgi:hypothetical protein